MTLQTANVCEGTRASRPLVRLFCLLTFLIPFEMLISMLMHGLLFRTIGDAFLLVTLGPPLLIVSFLLVLRSRLPNAPGIYTLLGLFLLFGLWPLVPSLFQTLHDISFEAAAQQLLFGVLVPIFFVLAAISLEERERPRLWLWFYAGWVSYFFLGLFVLYVSYIEALSSPHFAGLSLGQRIIAWRFSWELNVNGHIEMNPFSLYAGNANKTSNYILVFLLLSTRLMCEYRIKTIKFVRLVYFAIWILGLFYLLILLSRLAMLLLPFIIWQSGVFHMLSRRSKLLIALSMAGLVLLSAPAVGTVADYILTDRSATDSAINPLGTGVQRFEQWDSLFEEIERHPEFVYLGRGTGAYGIETFGDYQRGTHNMFLDSLEEGGLPGLLILVLIMFGAILSAFSLPGFRIRDSLSLSAMLVMLALMVREHSVAYLFVTSLGGLCFTVIFILPLVPESTHQSTTGGS